MLSNNEGNDGYIISYTPDFIKHVDDNTELFRHAFERAVDTWCMTTGLNYIVDDKAQNYDILVDYAPYNTNDEIPGVTVFTSFHDSDCAIEINNGSTVPPETHEVDFIDKVKITFNSNIPSGKWDASTLITPPLIFSVEQIALHELGHAHGLLHTNHDNEIMYFFPSVFNITQEAEDASNYIQDHSLNHSCQGGPYARSNCANGTVDLENNITINSIVKNGKIHVFSKYLNYFKQINLYQIDGKLINSYTNNKTSTEITIPAPRENGIYVISYISAVGIVSDKLLITN